MQKNNKNAFSLIIAVFLMMLMSFLALYLLEYIIPFSKNTKGMENGTKAYYEANKGIEDVLYGMRDNDAYFETGKTIPSTVLGYSYSLVSTGSSIPTSGNGTSEFDKDYNKISPSNPVQLLLKGNINWPSVNFYFKVPHFDDTTLNPIIFSGGTAPIINWQLSSDTDTLNASGTYITYDDISSSLSIPPAKLFWDRNGFTLSGSIETFSQFYTNNNCSSLGCILKLSIVNELKTNDSRKIPYLEYKIDFSTAGVNVANYYAKINSSGKSTGYKKSLELDIPQQTTIEAFDFTVFQ